MILASFVLVVGAWYWLARVADDVRKVVEERETELVEQTSAMLDLLQVVNAKGGK